MADLSNEQPMESLTFDRGNPERRCTAHRKNGEQCRKWAILGGNVCATHGGRAPHVVAKAQQRLREASDRMAKKLLGMAESENVPAYVALQAINSALDRAGVGEPKQVDVTVRPFEELLGDVSGGSRADYRRSIGDERADEPLPAIENQHRPGGPPVEASGVRVLGELPNGSLVIDVDQADDDTDDRTRPAGERVPEDHDESRRQSLVNPLSVTTPVRGYLPAEEAMEVAADRNRAYRYRMTRR